MKSYSIHTDLHGKGYRYLITFLAEYASHIQLISHDGELSESCRETLCRLRGFNEEVECVNAWPGTQLSLGTTALRHKFSVNKMTVDFISRHVYSLFSWRWPKQPEDLCFLASDGTPLLISTAHEQYAQLIVNDGMYIGEALESALKKSTQKGLCGFLVNMPICLDAEYQGENSYIGIEGDGWPVEILDMPTTSFGLACDDEYERCESYWRCLIRINGFESARLLYLGECPFQDGFLSIGFDCGYYSNGTDNFSLILNELRLRTMPVLAEYKAMLNEYGLFTTHEDASDFMRQVLSEPTLKDLYRGCLEDFSVVKVHSYLKCLVNLQNLNGEVL